MAACSPPRTVIKIEDSPEPSPHYSTPSPSMVVDPKDPEGFLKRCSGHNKKTRLRCSAVIGKNSLRAKNSHPTYLPTCHAHKDQQSLAGWCQFMHEDGERCSRLFRWTPLYLELCDQHQCHPDTPCRFLELPLELRQEIFRYLLPAQPMGSSPSSVYQDATPPVHGHHMHSLPPSPAIHSRSRRHSYRSPAPLSPTIIFHRPQILDLFLVSRQIHDEAKDLLYSSIPFTIDVRNDGTYMCGRRLLEPRRADGSAHLTIDNSETIAKNFLTTFDFASVKNYNVDILVENCNHVGQMIQSPSWDEEVEIYDIRDYVGVVVSGILSQSRNLCKLNIRLGLSKFNRWSAEQLLESTKCLVGPFGRLRNVRQPRFCGVFEGTTRSNFVMNVPVRFKGLTELSLHHTLCLVPKLPTDIILLGPGNPDFDAYKAELETFASQTALSPLKKPPIRGMFTEFKQFYTKLSTIVPEVAQRHGRQAFLHRARVAREKEDVEAFRHLRNELIEYWYAYLEKEEQRKDDMNARLSRMLDSDIYPSHEPNTFSRRASSSANSDPMAVLDLKKTTAEGIPVQGNGISNGTKRADILKRTQQLPSQWRRSAQAGPSGAAAPQRLMNPQRMSLNLPWQPPVTLSTNQQLALLQETNTVANATRQQETLHSTVPHTQAIVMPSMLPQQNTHWAVVGPNRTESPITPSSSSSSSNKPNDAPCELSGEGCVYSTTVSSPAVGAAGGASFPSPTSPQSCMQVNQIPNGNSAQMQHYQNQNGHVHHFQQDPRQDTTMQPPLRTSTSASTSTHSYTIPHQIQGLQTHRNTTSNSAWPTTPPLHDPNRATYPIPTTNNVQCLPATDTNTATGPPPTKRQRTDSWMSGVNMEINEHGDEAMMIDDGVDGASAWGDGFYRHGMLEPGGYEGKGKGKMRVGLV